MLRIRSVIIDIANFSLLVLHHLYACVSLKTGFDNLQLISCAQVISLLGDYDSIHVRRGDKIKTRKDRFGVYRTLHPHLDRDTRPEFIHHKIEKWVPPGRTLFIASNEKTPGFFSPLAVR